MKPLSFQRGFIANLLGFMTGKSLQIISSAKTSNSATGASLVINKPPGTVQGDLMVAFMCATAGATTWTGDTGWTEVIDQGANPDIRVAYLVAGASEGSSYTFTYNTAGRQLSGIIVTLRGGSYDTISTIDTSASPVAPSISAAASGSILLAFYASTTISITFTTPTGMAPVDNDADATGSSWALFSQTVSSGATGTRTSTPSTSSTQGGLLLSVKPS